MVTIKKYSNRRLYDTSESSYITLEELAHKIRRGTDVRVIDAKTERDLTQQVLAQIILESRGAAKLLPVPLLMRLIRMGDDNLAEFFGQYMSWALELYLKFKQGYQNMAPFMPFTQMFGQNNPFAQMFGQNAPWLQNGDGAQAPWQQSSPPPAQSPPPIEPDEATSDTTDDDTDSGEDVAELRQEMQQLKALMMEMAKRTAEMDEDDEKGE
ncbi:MAG: polyhydroxyalkanoate synthesis regulator DNA-binding domain-containing protein [Myxococcota bacterium]